MTKILFDIDPGVTEVDEMKIASLKLNKKLTKLYGLNNMFVTPVYFQVKRATSFNAHIIFNFKIIE